MLLQVFLVQIVTLNVKVTKGQSQVYVGQCACFVKHRDIGLQVTHADDNGGHKDSIPGKTTK